MAAFPFLIYYLTPMVFLRNTSQINICTWIFVSGSPSAGIQAKTFPLSNTKCACFTEFSTLFHWCLFIFKLYGFNYRGFTVSVKIWYGQLLLLFYMKISIVLLDCLVFYMNLVIPWLPSSNGGKKKNYDIFFEIALSYWFKCNWNYYFYFSWPRTCISIYSSLLFCILGIFYSFFLQVLDISD